MDNNDVSWQYLSAEDTVRAFSSNEAAGLGESSVSHRLRKFGENRLWEVSGVSFRSIAVKYILDGAFIFILADLLCAAFVGFDLQFSLILALTAAFTVFRVTMDVMLARFARKGAESRVPEALCVRDGKTHTIPATKLVPGDIVILREGDIVPADLRVIKANGLVVSEKGVTSNDIPVEKTADTLVRRPFTAEPENMSDMLFALSYVLSGEARAVCVATGDFTVAGKAGKTRKLEAKVDSVGMKKAEKVAAVFSSVLMAAALLYVFIGIFAFGGRFGVSRIFLGALSFAVAGYGTIWHSLVLFTHARRVSEIFSSGTALRTPDAADEADECGVLVIPDVSCLCDSRFSVRSLVTCGRVVEGESLDRSCAESDFFFRMLSLVSGFSKGSLSAGGTLSGMEIGKGAVEDHVRRTKSEIFARLSNARIAGYAPRSASDPLDTVIYYEGGEMHAVCAGDVDRVLALCRTVILDGFEETLTRERRKTYSDMARALEDEGCRVIALAHRVPPTDNISLVSVIRNSMSFAGFVAVKPVAAEGTKKLVSAFSSPERCVLCFASARSDACFAAGSEMIENARAVTVRNTFEANALMIEKGTGYVVFVPDDVASAEEAAKIRMILIRRMVKEAGNAVCIGSDLSDGILIREAKVRLCVLDKRRLRPASYSVFNPAHAIVPGEGRAVCGDSCAVLLRRSDAGERLPLIRKYLIGSQLARAVLLIVTLFLPFAFPAVVYLVWGFIVDGAICAFLLRSKGVGDYLNKKKLSKKEPKKKEKKNAKKHDKAEE